MNTTEDVNDSVAFKIFKSLTFSILSILGIGANLFCLIVLKQARYLKTPTRLFFASLTCADLLAGVFVIVPLFAVFAFEDIIPETLARTICFSTGITFTLTNILSIVSLLCVNFDRYIAIEYPLHSETIVTTKRARIVITCLWSITLVFTGVLFVFILDIDEHDACDDFFSVETFSMLMAFSIGMVFFSIIPLITTIVIYTRILIIVQRHKSMERKLVGVSNETVNNAARRKRFADRKALNTFLLVTVVSSLIWIPYGVFSYYNFFFPDTPYPFIDVSVRAISVSHTWINILIYTLKDRSFRKCAMTVLSAYNICKMRNNMTATTN